MQLANAINKAGDDINETKNDGTVQVPKATTSEASIPLVQNTNEANQVQETSTSVPTEVSNDNQIEPQEEMTTTTLTEEIHQRQSLGKLSVTHLNLLIDASQC